jgi:hypothetical protein
MSEPSPATQRSASLTLDARFAASNAEMVARITTKWAIVTLYITAASAFLGVAKSNTSTDDMQWLALAVPSLGAAATWIIFIQDAYIYSLIDFLAACESTVPKSEPDLRYNIGRWMAGDMKRQWWWQYAILAVIIIGLNFVTFLVAGLSCIGLAFIVIGTALSAAAILLSIRWGHSTQQSVDYFRQ